MSKSAYRREVEGLALALGYAVTLTRGHHYRFVHPSGARVFASSSPRNPSRTLANVRAQLRRSLPKPSRP